MGILRIIVLVFGILCMFIGWVITGLYLLIIATYKPIWAKNEGINTLQVRPNFIYRFLARLFDYIILFLYFVVFGGIMETVYPNSLIIFERFFTLFLLGYIMISLYLFKKTIGDKILKLELQSYREDGKLSFGQIFVRTFFSPVGAVQGLLFLLNSKKYLVHDRVSNTDMVKKILNT